MSTDVRYGAALDRVLQLVVLLGEDMARSLARDGLTVSRARVLWRLQPGPTTQRALADALGVSPRTITGLVDSLVATGFVTREPHPTDRRATLVTLTDHGARTVAALERSRRDLARSLFAALPDARFRGFVKGLDDVLARLRELEA
jgi:DNA-binding MarR family transcriptional regulator